jgi:hypothetical protein
MEIARGSRAARFAAVTAAALALAVSGCGGDDGGGQVAGTTLPRDPLPSLTQPPSLTTPAPPPSSTTPTPPGGTTPTPPGSTTPTPSGGYAPPPLRVAFGRGPTLGALVRERHAETSYGQIPPGFVPGGIPVGSRAGICTVPMLTDEVRGEIEAASRRQSQSGTVLPMHSDAILLADCGTSGRWALVTWTNVVGGDATNWIDELRYDGDGRWTGTPPRTYPGCRMPLAAAAVWQVDVRRCGAASRRPPSSPQPRQARPTTPAPPRSTQPQPQPAPRPAEPAPLDSVTI